MSYQYGQVLKSGLIVMAADRAVTSTKFYRGEQSQVSFYKTQKIFVTKHNIGITAAGSSGSSKKRYFDNTTLPIKIYEAISNIDIEKYKTPLDVAQYLISFTRSLDPDVHYVFLVGGFDTAGYAPKPVLYEAYTNYGMMFELGSKYSTEKQKIRQVNDGSQIVDIAINTLYPNINSEIIFPNADKINNFNRQKAIDFSMFALAEARKQLNMHCEEWKEKYNSRSTVDSISKELDILVIYDDHCEWIEREVKDDFETKNVNVNNPVVEEGIKTFNRALSDDECRELYLSGLAKLRAMGEI